MSYRERQPDLFDHDTINLEGDAPYDADAGEPVFIDDLRRRWFVSASTRMKKTVALLRNNEPNSSGVTTWTTRGSTGPRSRRSAR
ncbi:hypothetical protein [Plesiocystis pacifica]|uniref:hypothetical protein n=1 Tax=Plesiocystis pacifica TaxID=191768 RepID=UPI0002D5C555|nr:hypothetical protein [Plesiocystis pacifica]